MASALPATLTHLITPFPSTAKLPAVCQREPVSVGLFQIPSLFPSLYTSHKLQGFNTCHVFDTPRPNLPYNSRSKSTMTSTEPAPPTDSIHLFVAEASLWDTATQWMEEFAEARLRREMNVFSATVIQISKDNNAITRHGRKCNVEDSSHTWASTMPKEGDNHWFSIWIRNWQFVRSWAIRPDLRNWGRRNMAWEQPRGCFLLKSHLSGSVECVRSINILSINKRSGSTLEAC